MVPAQKKRRLNGDHGKTKQETNRMATRQCFQQTRTRRPSKQRLQKRNRIGLAGARLTQNRYAHDGFAMNLEVDEEADRHQAFFNVMLKDFGVKGVKVQELYGLDDDLLAMLPWRVPSRPTVPHLKTDGGKTADDINNQEAICPDNVWFANQLSDFSCATVSLLNIAMNVPDAELGEHLSSFKDFTRGFPPALRGQSIANFEFVRSIHNSFARKSDMLNIDLGVQNQYEDRRKSKKVFPQVQVGKGKKGATVAEDDFVDDDAAFHFSAYVPIDGEVWKLDGLDRQPQRLGKFDPGDWMKTVTPIIEAQMMMYAEGQIEFGLMSLVRDPLIAQREELAANIKAVRLVQQTLDKVSPDWWNLTSGSAGAGDADEIMGVGEEIIKEAEVDRSTEEVVKLEHPARLTDHRQNLITSQRSIRGMIREEIDSAADDEKKAQERRHDYGPVIYAWLKMLAEKEGLMQELVDVVR